MAFLKVFGSDGERTVFLAGEPVVVGRGDDTDVQLVDPKVSRRHCVVEPAGSGRWRVRDLESGNGTSVNGLQVGARDLRPDDVIEIGDTKLLFAGEAAAVVATEAAPPPPPRIARRRKPFPVAAGVFVFAVAAAAAVFVLGRGGGRPSRSFAPPTTADAPSPAPGSAQDPLAGFPELLGREPDAAIRELESRRGGAGAGELPAIERALRALEARREEMRERQFAELESFFDGYVEKGEYLLAYELWFYLRGDWGTIPETYQARIVAAMESLELRASGERSLLFEKAAEAEAVQDHAGGKALLDAALPRFARTSVARSLEERIGFLERAQASLARAGVGPTTVVRRDNRGRVEEQLARAGRRDFAGAAQGLRAIAVEASSDAERKEIEARAEECEAAAMLVGAAARALAGAKLPSAPLGGGKERWRVVAADADGFTASTKAGETRFAWADAPADLFVALLERSADGDSARSLGLAVAARASGADDATWLAALGRAYEVSEAARPLLDRFVAARVRTEPLPEGGYVVVGGELLTRQEHLRRVEEAAIARYRAQLDKALVRIREDKAFGKLGRLKEKKEALDRARAFALELIFDEKKYFYPYRNTGRDAEYLQVQKEVDARVDGVRAVWDDVAPVSIRKSPEVEKELKLFDDAAAELQKRLVDVDEPISEVAFLRSYLGRKLDVRTFYRNLDEQELLAYSVEVMADNEKTTGDITPVEREQVRITNEYRIMFGRWPVRLVEKLVLSSRGHCKEMSELGYFGHFSNTPGRRTPFDRMKLQGYDYGASENCIQGQSNPLGAHVGWCHSSGHHRNILMAPWTEMGTGAWAAYMTQNFGQAPRWSRREGALTATEEGAPGEEAD